MYEVLTAQVMMRDSAQRQRTMPASLLWGSKSTIVCIYWNDDEEGKKKVRNEEGKKIFLEKLLSLFFIFRLLCHL